MSMQTTIVVKDSSFYSGDKQKFLSNSRALLRVAPATHSKRMKKKNYKSMAIEVFFVVLV